MPVSYIFLEQDCRVRCVHVTKHMEAYHGELKLDLAGVLVGDARLECLVESLVDGLVRLLPVLDAGVVVGRPEAALKVSLRGLAHG